MWMLGILRRHVAAACANEASVSPVVISARQRIPSSLGSNHHAGRRRTPPSRPPRASAWNRRGEAISGAVWRAGEEREPVGPGLHEVELEARIAPAVQPERHLRVGPLDRLVPAVVEDADLARAVVTLRDRALERPVLERVDLGLHREPLVALRDRQALRDRPRRQRAVAFEADVVVQARRAVLVDHERVAGARRRRPARARSCPSESERSAADVLEQGRILRRRAISSDVLVRRSARRSGERPRTGSSSSTSTPSASSACRQIGPGPVADACPTGRRPSRSAPTRCRSGSPAARTRPRATSSQVSGVETGARGSGRSEYAAAMFAP